MPKIIDENGEREVDQNEYDNWFEAKRKEIEQQEIKQE